MPSELSLKFSSRTQVEVSFGDADSGPLEFENPVTDKDRRDIQWYVETYGAAWSDEPDDQEAKRIEARLPEIGKALFKAVFSPMEAAQLFLAFRDGSATQRVLTIDSQDASILALPWELLHDPTGRFLFREKPHISIRRRITGATGGRQPFRVKRKKNLHLLFVVSRPSGAGFIDPRADPRAVLDALQEHAPGRVSGNSSTRRRWRRWSSGSMTRRSRPSTSSISTGTACLSTSRKRTPRRNRHATADRF